MLQQLNQSLGSPVICTIPVFFFQFSVLWHIFFLSPFLLLIYNGCLLSVDLLKPFLSPTPPHFSGICALFQIFPWLCCFFSFFSKHIWHHRLVQKYFTEWLATPRQLDCLNNAVMYKEKMIIKLHFWSNISCTNSLFSKICSISHLSNSCCKERHWYK